MESATGTKVLINMKVENASILMEHDTQSMKNIRGFVVAYFKNQFFDYLPIHQ
jgi:hypothetical protein